VSRNGFDQGALRFQVYAIQTATGYLDGVLSTRDARFAFEQLTMRACYELSVKS
jgi:hypothetical protein